MTTKLQQELNVFRRELPRLLAEGKQGMYVLIHGEHLDSLWPDQDAALEAGYERFGVEQFMVREIVEHEKPVYFSRNINPCQ